MDFINAFPNAKLFVGTRITGKADEEGGVFVVLFENDWKGPQDQLADDILCITSCLGTRIARIQSLASREL